MPRMGGKFNPAHDSTLCWIDEGHRTAAIADSDHAGYGIAPDIVSIAAQQGGPTQLKTFCVMEPH